MPVDSIALIGATIARLGRTSSGSGGQGDFLSVLNESKTGAATRYDAVFQAASSQYGVPLTLLKAVAQVESSFNPDATSRCGAMGIMQLMPRTAKGLGVTDAYDPVQNIMGGAKYLRQMLNKYDGDVGLALAAYNAGPGTVDKHGGIPSFAQGYVNKVLRNCGGEAAVSSLPSAGGASSVLGTLLPGVGSGSDADSLSSILLFSALCRMRLSDVFAEEQEENRVI